MAKILTQRGVETAKPQAKRYGKPCGVVPGMQLVVQPSGAKSYALLARIGGKQVNIHLGAAGVLTLAQARDKARAKLGQIAAGKDPRAAKREVAAPESETFATVVERYIERYAKVHTRCWDRREQLFKYNVLPVWGDRPIDSIRRPDVVALLDSIIDRKVPSVANGTLAAIRHLFNWCIDRGTLETSPCDRIKMPAPKVARDRVLDDSELALVWKAAASFGYPYGSVVQLLMLTGQRRDEVGELPWSELNADLTMWALPGERAKNKLKHDIPITAAMRDILASAPRFAGVDYVFTTGGQIPVNSHNWFKCNLDWKIATLNGGTRLPHWVFHDLRRSCASGMARLGINLPVIEKVLNHISGSLGGIAGVYMRYDFANEKAEALTRWSEHVLSLVQPAPGLRIAASR